MASSPPHGHGGAPQNVEELVGSQEGSAQFAPSSSSRTRASSKRKSEVWQHYDMVMINNEERAICKICKQNFSCKSSSGTGHLHRHVQKIHGGGDQGREATQSQLMRGGEGNITNFKYSSEKMRQLLVELVICDMLPFMLIDSPYFEKFCKQGLNPQFQKISRRTLTRDCMVYFQEQKDILIAILSSLNYNVSLTSDIWSCSTQENTSYICVTCHWIDDDWNIQKRILSFLELEYPHNAVNIASSIMHTIVNFKIEKKKFSISFDNASNNTLAIGHLKRNLNPMLNGKLFHVRCACHIINLCVQEGLNIISNHIANVRNAISFIKTSGPRRKIFKSLCEQNGLTYKKLLQDVKTRWNSTFDMLDACLPYSHIISLFINEQFHGTEFQLTEYDWNIALHMKNFLERFKIATSILSGVYYPTTNLFFPQIYALSDVFVQYRDIECFAHICRYMESKFLAYWEDIPMLYCFGVIMDPRYKIEGFNILLQQFYENMKIDMDINLKQFEIKSLFNEMYDLYYQKYGVPIPIQSNVSSSRSSSSTIALSLIRRRLGSSSSSSSSSNISSSYSEYNFYMSTNLVASFSDDEFESLDILAWWRSNQAKFPVLSAMARDILTPPASTVSSEGTFSSSGRIIDERRSRLTPQHAEMCVCLRDWIAAANRDQHLGEVYHTLSTSGSDEDDQQN